MLTIKLSGIQLLKATPPSWDERLDPYIRVLGVSSTVVWNPPQKDNISFGGQEMVLPIEKGTNVIIEVMAANLVRDDQLVGSAELTADQIAQLLKSPDDPPMEIMLKLHKKTPSGTNKVTGELLFLAQGLMVGEKPSLGGSLSRSASIGMTDEDANISSSGAIKISKERLSLQSSVKYVRPIERPKSASRPGYIYLTDHKLPDPSELMLFSQPKSPIRRPKSRRKTAKSSHIDTRHKVIQTTECRVHEEFMDFSSQADIELPVIKPEVAEMLIQTDPDPEEERRRRMTFEAKNVQTQALMPLNWLRESAADLDHEVISKIELDRMLEDARNSQPPKIVYVEVPSQSKSTDEIPQVSTYFAPIEFAPSPATTITHPAPTPLPVVVVPSDLQAEFFAACRRGNIEELARLLKKGCDANMLSKYCSRTPLHIATFENQVKVVEFLLSQGADVDARDKYGNTALHFAAHYGFDTIVRTLLLSKADRTIRNKKGKLPVELAIEGRRPKRLDIIKLLLGIEYNDVAASKFASKSRPRLRLTRRRYDRHSGLLRACRVGDAETAKNILSFVPYSVFEEDNSGWTAFHMATSAGWEDIVDLLYASGSEIDSRTKALRTPLHIASYRGHASIVEFLLNVGADITLQDGDGNTALHHACYWGFVDIVAMLIAYGAQAKMRNNKGETAFDVARKGQRANRPQILDLLREFNIEESHERTAQTAPSSKRNTQTPADEKQGEEGFDNSRKSHKANRQQILDLLREFDIEGTHERLSQTIPFFKYDIPNRTAKSATA